MKQIVWDLINVDYGPPAIREKIPDEVLFDSNVQMNRFQMRRSAVLAYANKGSRRQIMEEIKIRRAEIIRLVKMCVHPTAGDSGLHAHIPHTRSKAYERKCRRPVQRESQGKCARKGLARCCAVKKSHSLR